MKGKYSGRRKIKPMKRNERQAKVRAENIEIEKVEKKDKVIMRVVSSFVIFPLFIIGCVGIQKQIEMIVWTVCLLGTLFALWGIQKFIEELKQDNIDILNRMENLDKNKILYLNDTCKI